MKKYIALVNLRYKLDIHFEQKESLALGYLSSVLKQAGYFVDVIDGQFFDLDVDEIYQKLLQKSYILIGFSLYQETASSFAVLHDMMAKSKLSAAHICLGGQFPSFTEEILLKKFPLVNSIVIGEGEETLLDLVKTISSKHKHWKEVKGLCYLENGQVFYSGARKLIANLDALPLPLRDTYYINHHNPSTASVIISASRGCYAKCSFCSIQAFYAKLKGKRIRVREPDKVVDEIEAVFKRYQINNFFFADDNFLVSNRMKKNWIDTFINELKYRKLNIKFDMDCRVNDIDVELLKRLKKNGLNGVFLGVESFNQRKLDTFQKNVTVQQNLDAIKMLKLLRINVFMGFIMFDMFTTLSEIREDVEALDKIKYFKYINYDRPLSSDWVASILQLYNGTPVLSRLKNEYPNLLVKKEFGYDFIFQHHKTERFYHALQLWKPIVKKLIKMDTLLLIRTAKVLNKPKIADQLHLLSRQYMSLDRNIFLNLLDTIDNTNQINFQEIIKKGKKEMLTIKNKVDQLKKYLTSDYHKKFQPI